MKELRSSLYLKLLETMNKVDELRKLLIEDIRACFLEKQDYELDQIGSIDLLETALVGTGCFLDTEEMETKFHGWIVQHQPLAGINRD